MDCEEIRRALGTLGDGEEARFGRPEVESHLSTCPGCSRAARAIEAERAYFGSLPRPAAPADLSARIRHRLLAPGARLVASLPFLRAVVAAASLLLAVTGGALLLTAGPAPAPPPALTAGRAVDRLMDAIVREGVPRIEAEVNR
jgi:predicted anti-sigma-YlaC factor YlaD